VEVAELDAFDKADMETVKHFLSKSTDRYRAAYAQYTKEVPRQCVFFGTTNTLEFLRDRTGNRRFNVIECHAVGKDVEKEVLKVLPTIRDQVWAEAYHRYLAGETCWLREKELRAEAEEVRERHSVQDELVGQLEYYLELRLPRTWDTLSCEDRAAFVQGRSPLELGDCDMRRDVVCVAEIRCELMGEDKAKLGANLAMSRRIAKILNTMPGWEKEDKTIRMGAYGPQVAYRRKGTKSSDPKYVRDPAEAV
jgi:predicted P-loop ATPase